MKQFVVGTVLLGLGGCVSRPAPVQQPLVSNPPVTKPCVATLSPPARQIYDAVQAGPTAGTLRDRISTQTRALVMDGDLARSQARPAAEEAADCLRGSS